MKFSEAKQKQLEIKLQQIFLDCVLKMKTENDMKYGEEWYFMERVWNENLVSEPKQLFLLGQLAQKIHDIGPKALVTAMRVMGILKDDDAISAARAYWVDKYGEDEAQIITEKLMPAFSMDKYSLEQIKSMGDKIEIMRGNA